RILERAFVRAGQQFANDVLAGALPRLARESVDDVLADVGRGELPSLDVIRAVFPDYKDERVKPVQPVREEGWFGLKAGAGMLFRVPGSRPVKPKARRE